EASGRGQHRRRRHLRRARQGERLRDPPGDPREGSLRAGDRRLPRQGDPRARREPAVPRRRLPEGPARLGGGSLWAAEVEPGAPGFRTCREILERSARSRRGRFRGRGLPAAAQQLRVPGRLPREGPGRPRDDPVAGDLPAHREDPGGVSVERRDPDVSSIGGIVRALYEVISGPAGAPRDWDRERKLFYPGAKLAPTRPKPGGGGIVDFFDIEGYIASRSPMFEK